MHRVAAWIDKVLAAGLAGEDQLARTSQRVRASVREMCDQHPLP